MSEHFTHTHWVQRRSEGKWPDVQPFFSLADADARCDELAKADEDNQYRVLSWLPTLTPDQLAEGDLTAELR